jgi:hypothetical protein
LDNLSGSSTWPRLRLGPFLAERHRDNSFARAATANLKLQKKAAPASRSRKLTTLILFLAHTSLCRSGHRSTAWPPLCRGVFGFLTFIRCGDQPQRFVQHEAKVRSAQQFCEQCLSFLNWLPPQIAPVQFKKVERAMPALASARCRRINSKTASPFSSQTIQIFIHPFSSFPPLNAIKKIAHTPAARTRSTTKVCIFKHLLSVSARPYGQPIYRPTSPW